MVQLIVINGLGGCGKSTFIEKCHDYCLNNVENMKVIELSTVDYVKKVAKYCGWNGGKSAKDRIFLSDLKQALDSWNNSPLQNVFTSIENYINENPGFDFIFFINSREPKDINKIYNYAEIHKFPIMKILVQKPGTPSNEVPDLISGINSISYDQVIVNSDSIKFLECLAKQFVRSIIFEEHNSEECNSEEYKNE